VVSPRRYSFESLNKVFLKCGFGHTEFFQLGRLSFSTRTYLMGSPGYLILYVSKSGLWSLSVLNSTKKPLHVRTWFWESLPRAESY